MYNVGGSVGSHYVAENRTAIGAYVPPTREPVHALLYVSPKIPLRLALHRCPHVRMVYILYVHTLYRQLMATTIRTSPE